MYNNSNICIIIPIIPRKKKWNLMMSWWCHRLFHRLNKPGLGWIDLEKKKKIGKKLCNFWCKQPVFHSQTLIHQSWPKNCTKTHKRRTIRNPNFWNPINWVPKKQKKIKWWDFLQKVFSTSLQHQFGLKTEN